MQFRRGKKGYEVDYNDSGKFELITNWLFLPYSKLIFEEENETIFDGRLEVFCKKESQVFQTKINMKQLDSPAGIKSIHPETAFLLKANKMQDFKLFFMETMKGFDIQVNSKAVKFVGIIKENDQKIYVGPGITTGGIIAFQDDFFLQTEMLKMDAVPFDYKKYLLELRKTHHSYVVDQILWWCSGVMLKHFINEKVRVPILFSYGKNNTGKTALHKHIIANIFSMGFLDDYKLYGSFEPTMLNLSGQSLPTLQRHAALSNFHPMMCDEFKYEKNDALRLTMSNFFRSNYDESSAQKAIGATSGLTSYTTARPVSMTGESAFKSEGAILDRSLIVYHRAFSSYQKSAFENFDWSKLTHIGNILLRALLHAQDVPWEVGPMKMRENISTRNFDTMNFLWNGAKLINDVFSVHGHVYSMGTILESINSYADHINIENANVIDEFFSCLEEFFEKKLNVKAFANYSHHIAIKNDKLYITFKPFESWLKKHKHYSGKGALSKLFAPIGFLKWVDVSPPELKFWSSVCSFDAQKFLTNVNTNLFPLFFKNIANNRPLDSVETDGIKYEDL